MSSPDPPKSGPSGLFTFTKESVLTESSDTFDPNGDLRLVIGEQKAESVVCSRSLARASPIFNKMLYGAFSESKPVEGDWHVELPEDDPYALCFLLNIIHGPFRQCLWFDQLGQR